MSNEIQIPEVIMKPLRTALDPASDTPTTYIALVRLIKELANRRGLSFVYACCDPNNLAVGVGAGYSPDLAEFAGPVGADLANTVPCYIHASRMHDRLAEFQVSDHFTLDDLNRADHQKVIAHLLNKLVFNRRNRFPWDSPTSEFKAANNWWPDGVEFGNPRDMESREYLNKIFKAMVAAYDFLKLKDACSSLSTEGFVLPKQLIHLIRNMKGETKDATYTKGDYFVNYALVFMPQTFPYPMLKI